jgi:hypothetical protein
MEQDSIVHNVDEAAEDRLVGPGRAYGTTVVTARALEGTTVYSAAGEKAGSIEDIMIDKVSGKIAYAVLAFGGFLGMGERHHPVPWLLLHYDSGKGGYVVELDIETVKDAPSFGSSEDVCWEDEGWGRRVHDYYKAKPYWADA